MALTKEVSQDISENNDMMAIQRSKYLSIDHYFAPDIDPNAQGSKNSNYEQSDKNTFGEVTVK